MTTTQSTRQPGQGTRSGLMWLLYVCDAGLLVASGLIHLHLWDIAYRHVKTLDVLFLVQVVLCLLAALTLLVTRHLLVVLGAAALMAGTIVGFLLARTRRHLRLPPHVLLRAGLHGPGGRGGGGRPARADRLAPTGAARSAVST